MCCGGSWVLSVCDKTANLALSSPLQLTAASNPSSACSEMVVIGKVAGLSTLHSLQSSIVMAPSVRAWLRMYHSPHCYPR